MCRSSTDIIDGWELKSNCCCCCCSDQSGGRCFVAGNLLFCLVAFLCSLCFRLQKEDFLPLETIDSAAAPLLSSTSFSPLVYRSGMKWIEIGRKGSELWFYSWLIWIFLLASSSLIPLLLSHSQIENLNQLTLSQWKRVVQALIIIDLTDKSLGINSNSLDIQDTGQ